MGSHLDGAAIIIFQGAATIAGKYPAGVELLAPQVAEVTGDCIGKEFAKDSRCSFRYIFFPGLIYAVSFIHLFEYHAIIVPSICDHFSELRNIGTDADYYKVIHTNYNYVINSQGFQH